MAKASAAAATPPAAPPPAATPPPAAAKPAAKATAKPAPAQDAAPIVIEYNDHGESTFAEIALDQLAADDQAGDGQTKPPTEVDPEIAEAAGETTTTEPPAKTEPAKSPAATRRERLDAIRLEREKRDIEGRLAETQAALKAKTDAESSLAAKLAEAEKRGTSIDVAKLTAAEREELLERLIIGVPAAGAAEPAKPPAEVAELKKKLEDLEARDQARERERQALVMQEAVAQTAAAIKDVDLPFVHAIGHIQIPARAAGGQTAYGLVLNTAYQAWLRSGKAGTVLEQIPAAAKAAEDWLQEQPEIKAVTAAAAKRAGGAAATAATGTPAARPAPAVGKRVAARSDASEELPLDPVERDARIKAEFGWR